MKNIYGTENYNEQPSAVSIFISHPVVCAHYKIVAGSIQYQNAFHLASFHL